MNEISSEQLNRIAKLALDNEFSKEDLRIIALACCGHSDADIKAMLCLSNYKFEKRKRHMLGKLKVPNMKAVCAVGGSCGLARTPYGWIDALSL